MKLEGRARVFGNDVNTDYIISSTRKRATIDARALVPYMFESLAPGFAASIRPGDIIVAGRNFGCGSAMEVAATVILASGIRAVAAETFSRSFFRNAINNGLLVVECDTMAIAEGHRLAITVENGRATVADLTQHTSVEGAPLPDIMLDILESGGLVEFLHGRGHW
jgi:3-isopropylmalate/(R)-2-methylmalate dehydratase small subunit